VDYDKELDDHIIDILYASKGTKRYFNELLKILNDRYYKKTKVSKRTLTIHLNKMEAQKIIERDDRTKRYKRYVWLSPYTIIQRKYHLPFNGVTDVKTTLNMDAIKEEKDKKLALFLILAFGYGCDKFKVDRSEEPRSSGLFSADPILKNYDISYYKEVGFSLSDLKSDFGGSSPVQTLLALNNFNEQEIETMLQEIIEHDEIPVRKIFSEDKEIRYYIDDAVLEGFLYSCVEILVDLIRRMEKQWCLLLKKPTKDESSWFSFVFGKEYITQMFLEIEDIKGNEKSFNDLCINYYYRDWKEDPKRIAEHITMMERSFPDCYTKKGIEKGLEIDDRKIQQDLNLIDSNKQFIRIKTQYSWILPSIKYLIRARFSKNLYTSDFFDK